MHWSSYYQLCENSSENCKTRVERRLRCQHLHCKKNRGVMRESPVLEIGFGPPSADFMSIWSSQKARKFRHVQKRSKVVRVLKSSLNWTKFSMTGPQLFSGWYQMIKDVFRCFQAKMYYSLLKFSTNINLYTIWVWMIMSLAMIMNY